MGEVAAPVHPAFARVTFVSPGIDETFSHDISGMRTRHAYVQGMVSEAEHRAYAGTSVVGGVAGPHYPPLDEEIFEWTDIIEAIDEARGTFVMVELGAGFGRWTVRAARFAAQRPGLATRFLAVEAEPTHFAWLRQHLADNGVCTRDGDLVAAAIAGRAGTAPFHIGEPESWYGQAIGGGHVGRGPLALYRRLKTAAAAAGIPPFRSRGQLVRLPAVTLAGVLRDIPRVDIIDLDIQGAEADVLLAAGDLLDARVRRLHIGTHSARIEAGLRAHFAAAGWECVHDYGCQGTRATPYGPVPFGDGVQSWRNPRLAPDG